MDAMQRAAGERPFIVLALMLLVSLEACGAEISDTGLQPTPEDGAPGANTGITSQLPSSGKGSAALPSWMPKEMMPQASSMSAGQAGAAATMSMPSSSAGKASAGPAKTAAAMSGGAAGAPAAGSGGSVMSANAAGAAGAKQSAGSSAKAMDDGMAGELRWLGRVDASDPKHVSFSWAGSGFAAVVKGSSVSVHLESQGDAIYYVPVIDGEPGGRIKVDEGEHVVKLADGLSDGEHEIALYRDTEGDGPVSIFSGFEQGTLVGAPKDSGRFFEIVGDSITVGFGSRGMERHGDNPDDGCGADHSTSSWFLTYEAVAARALNAEVSTVARSGYGMVRGYGMNKNVMPPLFDHTQGDLDEPLWRFERKPAALIINLGTNDWNGGDPGTSFETAYIKFVAEVRKDYPDTLILLTIGPTLDDGRRREVVERLEHVVAARHSGGDDKIDIFDIGIQDTAVTGCSWHPSESEHERVGMVLADELRMRLNW